MAESTIDTEKQLSIYQYAIKEVSTNTNKNILVNAEPGSGKSFMAKIIALSQPPTTKIYVGAFGSEATKELASKIVKSNILVKTFHSLTLAACKIAFKGMKLDTTNQKYIGSFNNYVNENCTSKDDKNSVMALMGDVLKIIALKHNTCLSWSELKKHNNMINCVEIDLVSGIGQVIFENCIKNTSIITFDETLYFCAMGQAKIEYFDLYIIDEAQDSNLSQIAILETMYKKHGSRSIFLGQPEQSIFGFRGSDHRAFETIGKIFDCQLMPLSISYRQPKIILDELINPMFNKSIESGSKLDGSINYTTDSKLFSGDNVIPDKSLILCRLNAPMVKPAFELLKRGVKCIIRGRDIGQNLSYIIQKIVSEYSIADNNLPSFVESLQEYVNIRIAKMKNPIAIQELSDKKEMLESFAIECVSITSMYSKIDSLFSDMEESIVFSSIHKAKGLESHNVYILYPDLMPSKKAVTDDDLIQEKNIEFVAYTRSLENITIVVKDGK